MATATISTYRTYIDLGEATVRDLEDIMSKLRELGGATYDPLTHVVTVDYEVGPNGAAEDLWDLRATIEDVEAELGVWIGGATVPKPVLVDPDAPPADPTWVFANGDGPEWRILYDYIEAHPHARARIARRGSADAYHTGTLNTQTTTHEGSKRTSIRVRAAQRRRDPYLLVHDLTRLQILVGSRYKPAADVLPV